MTTLFTGIFLISLFNSAIAGLCWPCTWFPWDSWSHCSRSCGGGYKTRSRSICCWPGQSLNDCLGGCGKSRSDMSETQECNTHCYNGGFYAGGRCNCQDIYYDRCCYSECPQIDNCKQRYCTEYWNTKCRECVDEKIFFKKTNNDASCERMCAWNGHYCWPGKCDEELTRGCSCAPGFKKIDTSSETSCQPTIKPSILTCDTVVLFPGGEKKRAMSKGNSTACSYLEDIYGNFQPSVLQFDMMSEYTVPLSDLPTPSFIQEYNFGVTDTAVNIFRQEITGITVKLNTTQLFVDTSSSLHAKQTVSNSGNISLASSIYTVRDGQALCAEFEANGGGYLKSKNTISRDVSSAVPYQKVKGTRLVCYRFDNVPPEHCNSSDRCLLEPIQLRNRITRERMIQVFFDGWTDPVPKGGSDIHASSIEHYEITVNLIIPVNGLPSKVDTKSVFNKKVTHTEHSVDINLTSDKPRLYSILLEVKDVADNVRMARRFLLYDNSTFITTDSDKPLKVASATSATNYTWQIHHHDICLDWKDRYLNQFYIDNEFLNPIELHHSGLISGVYDQQSGDLPISGTPNVYGIIRYMWSWKLKDSSFSSEIIVPNLFNQSYCQNLNVTDGQTYIIQIRPVDIAGNTIKEEKVVHIDRSVPDISNIWLTKDGYKTLFVHHTTDLSTMQLYFEATDPHSGIRNIEWTFGVTDSGQELASGALAAGTISEMTCPTNGARCYCPNIGACEVLNYTVPLNKLVADNKHQGDHNRNYYFTIKVTNHAKLSNTEHIDILVDDSPPESGVVYEGPVDSNDIDYTSDDHFIVHWHGFIDHESGIKSYRIGLANRCLGQLELYNFSFATDIQYYEEILFTETSTKVPANFTGKRFVTVIALNNAMDPSPAVCSDGITRDISPPEIRNISLQHARWSESVICHKGLPWLLHSSLSKVQLHNITECSNKCSPSSAPHPLAAVLPTKSETHADVDISAFMCSKLRKYDTNTVIYLPNDHIFLSWDFEVTWSQIHDFSVGIGRDASEKTSPSVDDYKSTAGKTYYKRQHEGIGADELFYLFLKAVTKAGLTNIVVIGPVLIDETPPLYRNIPTVEITGENVVVGWEKDTFYDIEQKEEINSVFFQIGNDVSLVTPLLQWSLESSEPCLAYSGGCFMYPVRRLQTQDTDLGLDFFVDMHVYNNAGHKLKVTSEKFKIPSMYPPGHAIVADLDPEVIDSNTDTNVHFTPNTVCISWTGFKHHESLVLQVGVGSSNTTDDIVSFRHINESDISEQFCIKDSKILTGYLYFALVKASCSGGTTVSSSDGVYIVGETELRQSLSVQMGEYCGLATGKRLTIRFENESMSETVDCNVTVGKIYTIETVNATDIFTDDGILREESNETFSFISYIEHPTFHLKGRHNSFSEIHILPCYAPQKYITTNTMIHAFWYYNNISRDNITFEVALVEKINGSFEYTTQLEKIHNTKNNVTFQDADLKSDVKYSVAVKQCSKVRCLDPVFSNEFEVDEVLPTGRLLTSVISTNPNISCYGITLGWETFKTGSKILFYQWTISKDSNAAHILTSWRTALSSENTSHQVSSCITLPVHGHSTLYGCVRAFTESGQHGTVCDILNAVYEQEYNREIVYDIDIKSPAWETIKRSLTSSNIGKIYSVLHDNELDFGNHATTVAGAMLYASERPVTWYLMTSREVPLDCDSNINCLVEKQTYTGYALFDKHVKLNTLYYICAYSNSTTVVREWFIETLDEFSSCSNGFVLDDIPPVPGDIHITNISGFITDIRHLTLTWENFKENIDAKELGYVNSMKGYKYAIGQRPGSEDIQNFTDVGLVTHVVIDMIGVANGATIFVTVNGIDQAGNSENKVSSQLIVDTSPPSKGHVTVRSTNSYIDNANFITSESVIVHLNGFTDKESGISHFEVGLGSHPFITDVLPLFVSTDDYVEINLNNAELKDGHVYYILARAFNHAGLASSFSSLKLMVDRSPPAGGHVMDGDWTSEKDTDFQIDTSRILGHWKGFSDEHSGLAYYRVGLGTDPYQDDVEPMVDVGLIEEFEWHSGFAVGETYYITVESCNRAGLCQARVSDGVTLDNSPPIQGLVRIGSDDIHQKFQSHTSSVHVRWAGFEDPQSGIETYEVCLGTTTTTCDLLQKFNCLLQSNIILNNLSLPTETDIYATVTAYNKVGMNVSQTSDSFRVDNTPPVLNQTPAFIVDYNSLPFKQGQWEKSILRLAWEFYDEESPISNHEVTLFTHHEGHTPVEHTKIGLENTMTINLDGKNWLHNGDTYYAVVTSCNAAGLCNSAQSDSLFIDSTPPHLGGFKPPMIWNNYNDSTSSFKANVSLSWYGFHDQESDIAMYYITVGRTYSGSELTEGVAAVPSNKTFHNFILKEPIQPDDEIILSIWAENKVGLNSSVARVTVNALIEVKTNIISELRGSLELQKHSCDVHFCNKDCTCAVIGKPCPLMETRKNCTELNATLSEHYIPLIIVKTGLAHQPQTITASSACLAGHWSENRISKSDNLSNIVRYEWSIGLKGQPIGEGIFDWKNEEPWQDIGLRTEFIYCLPVNRSLLHGEEYVIYVRAWFSSDMFSAYTSNPIVVDQTPPSVRRGRTILDSNEECNGDFDIIDWMDKITACWNGVFSEQQGAITHYTVSMGTALNSDDIIMRREVGLKTNITMKNLTLNHGTKYFFTVTAYNNVGLHTTAISDGFVVDMDTPVAGTMFNTKRHRNKAFQSNSDSLGFSWHGFQDAFSGIKDYYIAVIEDGHESNISESFTKSGLRTSYNFKNLTLEHGKAYRGTIQANDNAGHLSKHVISEKVIIDHTAPSGLRCINFTDISKIHEVFGGDKIKAVMIRINVSGDPIYMISGRLQTTDRNPELVLHMNRFHMQLPTVKNHDGLIEFGYQFLSSATETLNASVDINSYSNITVDMSVKECTALVEDKQAAVVVRQISRSFVSYSVFVVDKESSLYKVELGAGTTKGAFQIKALIRISQTLNQGLIQAEVPHGTPVYVTVIAENRAGLKSVFYAKPVIMDHTAPLLADLSAKKHTIQVNDTGVLRNLTVVEGSWTVSDGESGIKYCFCSLGHQPGLSDILSTWLTQTMTSCTSDQLLLQHGETIYLTVKCVNNVEISTELSSRPLFVSLYKPTTQSATVSFVPLNEACYLYDTPDSVSVAVQSNRSDVQLCWDGFVELSGIDHFEYRLLRGHATIVDWTSTGQKEMSANRGLHLADGNLTAEVRAVNSGLYTSDAIRSSMLVVGAAPALTGRAVAITRNGNKFQLDWAKVFDKVSGVPLSYSVIAGTRPGFTDLLDLSYISDPMVDVTVPESTLITPRLKELFINIVCTYATGQSTSYKTSYKIE